MSENPADPQDRRLTGILDLWNDVLVAAIFGLALLGAAWVVWNAPWGVDAVWSDGAWRTAAEAVDAAPYFEVREPSQSWKANLFYGCVMGLVTGVPACFVRGGWKPWPAIVAEAGIGFFLWMVQFAVLYFSRTASLSDAGLEERSFFGARRIPGEQMGGLEFQDVRRQLEWLNNIGQWQTRKFSTLPCIDAWEVRDREGRTAFPLPADMTPPQTFQAMRDRMERRTAPRWDACNTHNSCANVPLHQAGQGGSLLQVDTTPLLEVWT